MFAIIGLGNKGDLYKNNRHNVGFIAIDHLLVKLQATMQLSKKFEAKIAKTSISDHKVILIKPQQYMNNSGISVQKILSYYNIATQNTIVIHDDIDLPLSKCKIKQGGGSGGHNGIKSLDNYIGQDYLRIRIGISRPENQQDVTDYVLGNFNNSEKIQMLTTIDHIVENFSLILENKLDNFTSSAFKYGNNAM